MSNASSLVVHQLCFKLANDHVLFDHLSISFPASKTGLVGRNGCGKSTLVKLLIGALTIHSGVIQAAGSIAYVPQIPDLDHVKTVADFFDCAEKLSAWERIKAGSSDLHDYQLLDEDWQLAERLQYSLTQFGLQAVAASRLLSSLSGGELTRLALAKAFGSAADFLILDEPSNHLDSDARKQLLGAIQQWPAGLILVSHDRQLLNQMACIVELTSLGAILYGGNYDFYHEQKAIEHQARTLQVGDAKKALQQARLSVQTTREKHSHKAAQGREKRNNGSMDLLMANSKRGRSERSLKKMLIKEQRMITNATMDLTLAKSQCEIIDSLTLNLPKTFVPQGKILLLIEQLCFSYSAKPLIDNFSLCLQGSTRIALTGANGCGKSSLLKLIIGELTTSSGSITLGTERICYLDQRLSLLDKGSSLLANYLRLNPQATEFEAYHNLAQFLFKNVNALKYVKDLSGGEKLRALLACVLMAKHPPQLLILDEPTNHLDIASIESIESALTAYQGAMLVVSHDTVFLKNIGIEQRIAAPFIGH